MKSRFFSTVILAAFTLLVLLSACTPSDGVLEVEVAPAESPTGDELPAELRIIAQAFLGGFPDKRLALMEFIRVPCTTADGLGGPPKCAEGQPDGTEVEVFPLGGGEGSFTTRETVMSTIEFMVRGLFAIYQVPKDAYSEPFWPAGEYALLFERDQNDLPLPITVRVAGGKVVRIDFGVGTPPEEILKAVPVELILVPPAEVENWLNP